jgi:hypothetical protein
MAYRALRGAFLARRGRGGDPGGIRAPGTVAQLRPLPDEVRAMYRRFR